MCKFFDKLFKKIPVFRNKQKEMLINTMAAFISVELSKRLAAIEGNSEDSKRFHYTQETLGALKELSVLLSKKFICPGTNLKDYRTSSQQIFKNLLSNTVMNMYSFDISSVSNKCATQLFNVGYRPRYYVYEDYFGNIVDVDVNAVIDKELSKLPSPPPEQNSEPAAQDSNKAEEEKPKKRRSRKKKVESEPSQSAAEEAPKEEVKKPDEPPAEEILRLPTEEASKSAYEQTEMDLSKVFDD